MASEASAQPEGAAHAHQEAPEAAQKAPVKRSWRRKYRKMRVRFEETMNTSNTLIRDEFRAIAVARRLQEQNDQIMELLLDLNEQKRLPANLRYDLHTLAEDSALPPHELDPEAAQRRLQELRTDLVNNVITPEEYARRESELNAAQARIPGTRMLSTLEATIPHTTSAPDPLPEGVLLGDHAPGYMSPAHEEEYLMATDAALADPNTYDPNAHDGRPLRIPQTRPVPTEKELSIQNPDSVYNWLRKHQPQVFLQDKDAHGGHENVSEKSGRAAGSRAKSSRQSNINNNVATPGPKTDHELDEDGFAPESVMGRKVKDDDHAYRPKGGSSRPSKRKRDDGEGGGKGSSRKKAARPSAAGAAAAAAAAAASPAP